jgi:16S rRNA (guanine527-N7)-methyltransferase
MELIIKHFPHLSEVQIKQFEALESLYKDWNEKINVISRKDTENFYERHVLHSLGIAKVVSFQAGSRILDVGTGGGFPGIPLAILYPETQFLLVDSIGKKIKVVKEVATCLNLKNVVAQHLRAEQVKGKFDFVISRAVTRMPDFILWVEKKIEKKSKHPLSNGILYLKGGDLTAEMLEVNYPWLEFELKNYFSYDFFETKKVVHVSI